MEDGIIERLKDFLDTKTGKAAAAGVLGALALLVVALVYMSFSAPSSISEPPVKPTLASVPSTQTTEPAGLKEEPVAIESYTQADFRDPFKPVEDSATAGRIPGRANPSSRGSTATTATAAAAAAAAGPGSLPSTGTATQTPPGTQSAPSTGSIKLISIGGSGAAKTANIQVGSAVYTVKTGDTVGNTSYRVASIGDSNITLLLGNDTLVLSTGQSPK